MWMFFNHPSNIRGPLNFRWHFACTDIGRKAGIHDRLYSDLVHIGLRREFAYELSNFPM